MLVQSVVLNSSQSSGNRGDTCEENTHRGLWPLIQLCHKQEKGLPPQLSLPWRWGDGSLFSLSFCGVDLARWVPKAWEDSVRFKRVYGSGIHVKQSSICSTAGRLQSRGSCDSAVSTLRWATYLVMVDNEGFFPFSLLGNDWHWLQSQGGCWARLTSGSGQWIPWFCRLQEVKYWLHWGQETTARILTVCVFQEHGNYCSSRHIFFRNGDNGPQISVTLRLGMLIECTTFALIDCSVTFLPLLWAWMSGRERQKRRRKEGQSWLPPPPSLPFALS